MATFSLVSSEKRPQVFEGRNEEYRLTPAGLLWCKHQGIWSCNKRLIDIPGAKIHIVSDVPPYNQGKFGDIAVDLETTKWWKCDEHILWHFQGRIVNNLEPCLLESPTFQNLRVDGCLSLPIVDGKLLLFDSKGQLKWRIAAEEIE